MLSKEEARLQKKGIPNMSRDELIKWHEVCLRNGSAVKQNKARRSWGKEKRKAEEYLERSQKSELIYEAFRNENYKWRTVRGLSKEANVSNDDVYEFIYNHQDEIVKSTSNNMDGENLYALRDALRENRGVIARIIPILKNRGG